MSDIFISYARATADIAQQLATAFRATDYSVWLDEQLPANRLYADEIADRLDAARAVVVLWSHAAIQSQWVRSEADRARINGTLVQLTIDDARLPMPFDQIHCVDLSGWAGDGDALPQQVLDSVARLNGRMVVEDSVLPCGDPMPRIPSVAVLPFKHLSAASDEDYFCAGVVEEIVAALAPLPGLRVAASALAGSGRFDSPLDIARSLRVDAWVEGSVRKAGERARVAVRLVQASDGFTLWADSFDRSLSDIFAVQDEITRAIVAALGVRLLARDEASIAIGGTVNPKAHDLYLRARQLVRRELEVEARTAAEMFREATREDPGFALAFAGLAYVLARIARWKVDGWREAGEEAVAAAETAVRLAPGLAEAHLAHGDALRLGHDPGAGAAFQLAVELSPHDASVHYRYARFLVLEGDKAGAIRHYERAFALAPDDYRYIVYALQEYQALGDSAGESSCLQRASAAIDQHLMLHPEDVRAFGHGAGVLALMGRSDEAKRYIAKALAFRPDDYGNLATLACAAMLNRDADQALDLLEHAVRTGRGDREWMVQDNDLKPLHGHPRFEALLQRMT